MTAATLCLLGLAVAALLVPGRRWLATTVPPVLAVIAVASGLLGPGQAGRALRPLAGPLGFVLLSVPLAVLLDQLGFFSAIARRLASGRHYLGACWLLAALVVALLNLDAAVVLLTPLYVRIADQLGADPVALALQPLLLSCLASSALPISNLTNLIAAGSGGASTGGFLVHLALPTVAATLVGWFAYRRLSLPRLGARGQRREATSLPAMAPRPSSAPPAMGEWRVLVIGGLVVAFCVTGFLLVPSFGGAPWEVAAGGDVVLVVLTRRLPLRTVPWSSVGTVLGLGVLAAAGAAHLPLQRLLSGSSPLDLLRTTGLVAAGGSAFNNLPALLVSLPVLHRHGGWGWPGWAALLGDNVGPLALPSGTLAGLLWLGTMRRLGVHFTERDYLRVAWRVALPSLVAATAVLEAARALLGASQ
ncbi:MAG: Citrate transporter [Acidimicrobiaceae bacterium]|nr:Citrate transporter [Acidimicrobiaceae bacterium]